MKYLVPLIPIAACLSGLLGALAVVGVWLRKQSSRVTRSPLTRDLLRPPGSSLRAKISDLNLEILLDIVVIMLIPPIIFALHISQSYFAGEPETPLRWVIAVGVVAATTIYFGKKLISKAEQLRSFLLGLEGELATGEELNQLMLDGCRVFHDIPFPYGNIDHVVVSQSGVFSVNTKLHGKPKSGDGNVEITVDQQRGIVRFPDGDWLIPLDQFEAEKNWLSQFLSNSVGRPVNVEPILALPGWFVKERIGRGLVYVINPHNAKRFFVQNRQVLSAELVQRIAHQLDQLCRDIKPSDQEQRKRWEDVA